MPKSVAFALAGLGGFNAHGAGFLAAATKHCPAPDLVTATSGQIVVLADWLADPELKETRANLLDPDRETDPFAQMKTLLFGYRGVFEPAFRQAITRWWDPPGPKEKTFDVFADRLWPAQLYVPTRSRDQLETMAATFNASKIGVVFNAYDFKHGTGVLYGNDAARARWPQKSNVTSSEPSGDTRIRKKGPREPTLKDITPDAVKAALWLSLYGFEGLPRHRLDGAYHRSCIVSELHGFDRVFAVRPLANGWTVDSPPRNYFDVQDWQTEMWFSASYKAEIAAMARINDLIRDKYLTDEKFKEVELVEVAPETPAGYFNYFIEHQKVFDAAYDKAETAFEALAE